MYINECAPSNLAIMAMAVDTWADVDQSMLKMKSTLRAAAQSVPSSTTGIFTPQIIAPSHILATSFLKYVHVILKDKSQILNFYKNLVTQYNDYNVSLTPEEAIT